MRFFANAALAATIAFGIVSCNTDNSSTNVNPTDNQAPVYRSGDVVDGQYIVVFNDNAVATKGENLQSLTQDQRLDLVNQAANRMADKALVPHNNIQSTYAKIFRGVVMTMNDDQLAKLRKDPGVQYIEQDRWVSLPRFSVSIEKNTSMQAQSTPWGITDVGGSETPSSSVTAWIVDTGIDLDHPDLNVITNRCKSFVKGQKSADDGNGHGTHVAGTVGAKDNTIGVIGVAPGIKLVAMRVLGANGSGQFSWSVNAFEYVANNGASGDVVNYSVGPGSRYTSTTLDNAVKGMADEGIKVCLAAGNEGDDATYYSPARTNYTNVFTIAAMNSSHVFASWSNYGSPVDWIEPGVSITSCWKGGGYSTISGTSMATPHATGMCAVGGITSGGTVTSVPSGTTTSYGVRD